MIYEEDVPLTGAVKLIHPNGYGFILPDEGGKDVFIPHDLCRGFVAWQRVRYVAKLGLKGPVAVRIVDDREPIA